MRLGYVGLANAHEQSRAWWRKNGQDPDRALHLVRTWAWSPWLQEYQQRLGHALHERTPLPNTWKEAAIVRVCGRVGSTYELFHHVPLARAVGLPPHVIDAAVQSVSPPETSLEPEWHDLLAVIDALDADGRLSSDLWATATRLMSIDQLVALNAVVGYWRTNARLALMCELETESWMHPESATVAVQPGAPREVFVPSAIEYTGVVPVPSEAALGDRGREWLGRASPKWRHLVRWWSWIEDVQVANQRWWDCLDGDLLELDRGLRGWIGLSACDAVGATSLGTLLSELFPVDHVSVDVGVVEFVASWESARPLDPGTTAHLLAVLGRRQLVEIQLVCGFVGTQARLSNLMDGPA